MFEFLHSSQPAVWYKFLSHWRVNAIPPLNSQCFGNFCKNDTARQNSWKLGSLCFVAFLVSLLLCIFLVSSTTLVVLMYPCTLAMYTLSEACLDVSMYTCPFRSYISSQTTRKSASNIIQTIYLYSNKCTFKTSSIQVQYICIILQVLFDF